MPLILKRMQKIEHIGIAVSNIEEASKTYEALLNSKVYKTETVASEGVITAFLKTGPNKIELLPTNHHFNLKGFTASSNGNIWVRGCFKPIGN